MKALWQAFAGGVREGWRPLCAVAPSLIRSMAVCSAIVLAGLGVLVLGNEIPLPEAGALIFLGKGLLIGGAAFGVVVVMRGWWALLRAAGFEKR